MEKIRARAIIVKEDAIALIKRIREDKVYYVFPGGGVENNETVEDACVREIKEELGLDISVGRKIAEVLYSGDTQHFFLGNFISGIFGSGDGEEYQPGLSKEIGIHEPVWMSISDLLSHDVRPKCLCEIVINGYPEHPKKYIDIGDSKFEESPSI